MNNGGYGGRMEILGWMQCLLAEMRLMVKDGDSVDSL
jgi:hypothetical protein